MSPGASEEATSWGASKKKRKFIHICCTVGHYVFWLVECSQVVKSCADFIWEPAYKIKHIGKWEFAVMQTTAAAYNLTALQLRGMQYSSVVPMDQITKKTPNPKGRLS